MRRLISLLWNFIFGCRHPHNRRSYVWTEKGQQYRVCLDCGKRLEYTRISFRGQEA
jgi:hypothetical protein